MKRIIMVGLMVLVGSFAFGQRWVNSDPTYDVNNYKQPNKAAYAKAHHFGDHKGLETVSINQRDNYKQPYNQSRTVSASAFTATKIKTGQSYKHPRGL